MKATGQQEHQKKQKSKVNGSSIVYKSKNFKQAKAGTEIEQSLFELEGKVKSLIDASMEKSVEFVRKHPVAGMMGAVAIGITIGFFTKAMRPRFKKSREE